MLKTTNPVSPLAQGLEALSRTITSKFGQGAEVELSKGSLTIVEPRPGVYAINSFSDKGTARWSITIDNGELSVTNSKDGSKPADPEAIYWKTFEVLNRALTGDRIKSNPAAYAAIDSSLKEPSPDKLEKPRLSTASDAWRDLDALLTSEGKMNPGDRTSRLVDGGAFRMHIMRHHGTNDSIGIELASTSYRREVMVDTSISIKPDAISYHLPDDAAPYKDQEYALSELRNWMKMWDDAGKTA
jgi:hypothetical protein